MGGAYTESQKKAANKYFAEKIEDIRIRVPKGEKELIKATAEQEGKSVNAFILETVHKKLNQKNK